MKEYIILTRDGTTFDNEGNERENVQVLDFIEAEDLRQAWQAVESNDYGAYEDIYIRELKK